MRENQYDKIRSVKNMKERLDRFHHKKFGCKIISKQFRTDNYHHATHCIVGGYCETHQVGVCRCGWQFGYHYGTNSKKLAVK